MNEFLMLMFSTVAGALVCGIVCALFADRQERKDGEK